MSVRVFEDERLGVGRKATTWSHTVSAPFSYSVPSAVYAQCSQAAAFQFPGTHLSCGYTRVFHEAIHEVTGTRKSQHSWQV